MAKLRANVRCNLATIAITPAAIALTSFLRFRCGLLFAFVRRNLCRSSHVCRDHFALKNDAPTSPRLPSKIAAMLLRNFIVMRSPDCFNGRVYAADELRQPGAKSKGAHPPGSENASRHGIDNDVLTRSDACLGKAQKAWGWQDKANWRSPAPFGRKSLSAHCFLHFARPSRWHVARCNDRPRKNFLV